MERRNFLKLVCATLISPTLLSKDIKPLRICKGPFVNVLRIWISGEEVDVEKFVDYILSEPVLGNSFRYIKNL